eukprot:253677_1
MSIENICNAVGVYYQWMSRNDYYDADNKGKFSKWCENEGYEDDALEDELQDDNEDDCGLLDFDDNFPFPLGHLNEQNRNKIKFSILNYCYKHNVPPPQYKPQNESSFDESGKQ